ncbi:uncharacterized protein [Halyomorpha halys]|uniref:uncharacterized protein n=1 Tax=Halyomorpha halys TaxID=286706 RepID=UPI0006D4DAE0|nr:uncharacterized protein LOC106686502 [Halyomorpha halys]XP_014285442.1 uncharacterized protein LOC106686502 [Halyomorpha halys]
MAFPPDFGEDELKWKFDRCVTDTILKTTAAAALSFLGAKLFFHKKHLKNILVTGVGAGLGIAWLACEREFQQSLRICKTGYLDQVIPCTECKKSLEERKIKRELRMKEEEERKKRIEEKRLKELELEEAVVL